MRFTRAAVADKIELVRRAAGDRWRDIEFAVLVRDVVITDRRRAAARRILDELPASASQLRAGVCLDEDAILDCPHFCIGTPAQIAEQLARDRDELGLSQISPRAGASERFVPVMERLSGR